MTHPNFLFELVLFECSRTEAVRFSPAEAFDTPAELMGRTFNRPRTAQLATGAPIAGAAPLTADSLKRLAQRANKGGNYKELVIPIFPLPSMTTILEITTMA